MPVPGSVGRCCASQASRSAGDGRSSTSRREALAVERTAEHDEVVAELGDDVVDDAVVGGRGGAEHRDARGQQVEDAREAAVVGAEVVAPVADAVRLVDHEQADASRDELGQHVVAEPRVGEALGRDEQQVDRSSAASRASISSQSSRLSLLMVSARTPARSAAIDLVAHEREQRRDEQRRPRAVVAQEPRSRRSRPRSCPSRCAARRAPVAAPLDERLDRLPLVVAELARRDHPSARGAAPRLDGAGSWPQRIGRVRQSLTLVCSFVGL